MTSRQFTLSNFALKENSDRRIIAAIRCTDAITGSALRRTITVHAPDNQNVRFVRNLSGQIVLTYAPGFEAYQDSFSLNTLSTLPPPQQLRLSCSDSRGHYLPRNFALNLPRNPDTDPTSLASAESLFSPVMIPLYPSGLLPLNPGWATLRATITNSTGQRLPWSLVRIEVDNRQILAQADHRGEAMIVVPGLPITTWSTDNGSPDNPAPVTTREFDATLTLFADPNVVPLAADTDFFADSDPNAAYRPNPDELNSDRTGLLSGQLNIPLVSGSDRAQSLSFDLTPL